ncbi:MAG: Fic family protein [Acidithiobacillus sp.]
MNQPKSGRTLTAEQRQALEATYAWQRLVELHLDPVQGKFDAAHLKEINRRIFQDLPSLGFDDVTPGQYRPPVIPGKDWIKTRRLETVGVISNVAYSPMDRAAQARLDKALQGANPAALGRLNTAALIQAIGKLYAELDYIHPFGDGNSRTLREFTRSLAETSGYTLDWGRFGNSPAGRDIRLHAGLGSIRQFTGRPRHALYRP